MIVRRRGGHSSSSVAQEQTRMALREQSKDVTSESQQTDEETQLDEDLDDGDDKDEFSTSLLSQSSARGKSIKKEHKTKSKKMTEEEMMDLALRLSEQEASATALRQQQEEEAMRKAIQESMGRETQLYPPSQSQSLLPEAQPSLRLSSRRKLLLLNGKTASASQERSGANGPGHENNNRNKKRKRKEGSPLMEMPDLSQKSCSQASSCSSMSPSVLPDSPESCDSTQIDETQPSKSPVFPSTDPRPEVHVKRLSQGTLHTCRSSGFVLCSQDSLSSNPNHLSAQPKSPTFSKSPSTLALSKSTACPKSPVFSETDQVDDEEMELSPKYYKSPVFDRNLQHERLPTACKPTSENSGCIFSSQESLSSSVRPTSCWSRSPVFPRSSSLPKKVVTSETSAFPKSPVPSDTERGQDRQKSEQSHGHATRTQNIQLERQKKSVMSSAAELRGSGSEEDPHQRSTKDPPLCLRQDRRMEHSQDGTFNKSTLLLESVLDDTEQLNESPKEWNSEIELTSDMRLHWSDEDVTPVGSPSPIFPEEKLVHQADGSAASLNHATAASPGTNGTDGLNPHMFTEDQSSLNRRVSLQPSTSSTSTCREQFSSQSQPVSSRSAVSGEPEGGLRVHYYWGVPFCPRGLNPDSYTQVILAQMEVYEKSLKQAQRCLLRKAEWGEPILPQLEKSPSPELPAESTQEFVPRRRGLRLRGRKLSEAADSPAAETEEEEGKKDEDEKETGKKGEEKNERGEEDEQVDTDDCRVCPETQLSDNDSTQDLMITVEDGAKMSPQLQPKSPEQPEVEMILQVDSPARDEQQEEENIEVDAPVDTEMEGNHSVSSQNVTKEWKEEDRGDLDVEEIKDRWHQRSKSPEPQPLVIPQRAEANVDCPICQGSFPVAEIEMHAAYCDGEVAVVQDNRTEVDCFQVTSKLRKRTRRADEPTDPSNVGKNQEKCFICQKAVPLRAYSRHTELCIQQQATKPKGNLLSALQQTESRDSEAGPSGSRLQTTDVIDLRDDDDDDDDDDDNDDEEEEDRGTGSRFRISKKQQPAKKPSQRRR